MFRWRQGPPNSSSISSGSALQRANKFKRDTDAGIVGVLANHSLFCAGPQRHKPAEIFRRFVMILTISSIPNCAISAASSSALTPLSTVTTLLHRPPLWHETASVLNPYPSVKRSGFDKRLRHLAFQDTKPLMPLQ
jgi:hypothetical protein